MIDLTDVHARTHRNLEEVLAHCVTLTPDELDREFPGYGYPSVRQQLHHSINAEKYWVDVLNRRADFEDDADAHPDLASIEALRARTFEATRAYLRETPPESLAEGAPFVTWGGNEHVLAPANVILRTITHHYHHMGLAMSICRLIGKPAPGVNYPIT